MASQFESGWEHQLGRDVEWGDQVLITLRESRSGSIPDMPTTYGRQHTVCREVLYAFSARLAALTGFDTLGDYHIKRSLSETGYNKRFLLSRCGFEPYRDHQSKVIIIIWNIV